MKKIMAFLLAVVLMFGIGWAEEETYWIMCNPNSFVFVREFPKKNGKEGGYLYYGDEVTVDGEKKNGYWHIVETNTESGEGWVKGLYLVDEKPDPPEKTLYCVSSKGRLALRNGVNGRKIGWLANGDLVRVYGKTSEWAVTRRGYVKIKYLDIEGE